MPDRQTLTESVALTEAAGTPKSRRFRARLIEGDILGSSGYYPAKVLERDGPTAWPEGTQVFLDHPSESEQYDRPERSVRDLAGRIASTPAYEADGLYADVEVYPHVAPVIEAMAGDIGMSIRAAAEVSEGEVDGQQVRMIDRIVEGISVDFVTRAGAGGKLVALLESARQKQAQETTPADTTPTDVPVPAGQITTTESQGETMGHIQVDEAEHRRLTEAAGRVETLESKLTEAQKRADDAEQSLAVERARHYARDYGTRRVREANSELPAAVVERVITEAMRNIPLGEDGRLDAEAFGKQVDEARTAEESYLTSLQETVGRVRGLGGSDAPQITEADVDNTIAAAFGRPRVVKGA